MSDQIITPQDDPGFFTKLMTWDGKDAEIRHLRERNLARAIVRMLDLRRFPTNDATSTAKEMRERTLLLTDLPLSAFWLSVSEAGEDGWMEEKTRIMRIRSAQIGHLPTELRRDVGTIGTVRGLLGEFRQWGKFLLNAKMFPEIDQIAMQSRSRWERL